MTLAVMGSGAFGTALAIAQSHEGPVLLWSRSAEQAEGMRKTRQNDTRLPGQPLPDTITPTSAISDLAPGDPVLIAVPMQKLRDVLTEYRPALDGKNLVICCKGIELSTGLGPIAVTQEVMGNGSPALLTGPSFAADIARGLPTALTLACEDATLCKGLQTRLSTGNLRLYRTTDTIGAEIGGALKNVMAIACGAVIGAQLGESARAALMTRGYAEMVRFAVARGGQADTLAGLSGFGDLALTCSSDLSRNYRLGLSIGRDEEFDPSITVEGAATARAILANMPDIDMPITRAVVTLIDQKQTLNQVISELLSRSLKEE